MDLQELRMPKATGIKFVLVAKEIVKNTVTITRETDFSLSFRYKGYYGKVEFSDMLPLVSVSASKKLQTEISDEDKKLIPEVNALEPYNKNFNPALLELNRVKNTCSAGTVIFLESGFDGDILLIAINQCVTKLQAFLDRREQTI